MASTTASYGSQPYSTTSAQHRHAPAGTGSLPVAAKTQTYAEASSEVKALIRNLNNLANATTMDEHALALNTCDEDLVLDTPFIQVQGRERIRVLSTLVKNILGRFEIEPRMVRIVVPEGAAAKGGKLEVDGVVHWMPWRRWYIPATLLLPSDIPIYADVSMGVKAHNDKVYFISGKNHNLPHVPRLLRIAAGYVAGLAASIAEPAYNTLIDWYHAGIEGIQNTTATVGHVADKVTDKVGDVAGGALDTATAVKDKVTDTTGAVMHKAAETVGLAK